MNKDEQLREIEEERVKIDNILVSQKNAQLAKLKKDVFIQLGLFAALVGGYFVAKSANIDPATMGHIRNGIIAINGANIALGFNNIKKRIGNIAHFEMQMDRNKLNQMTKAEFVRDGKNVDDVVELDINTDTLEDLHKAGKSFR